MFPVAFLLLAASCAASASASASASPSQLHTRGRGLAALNAPCDPSRCVLATFKFVEAVSECGGCHPPDSKWRCPSRGNLFEPAFEATFGGGGFGEWSTSQCVHKTYSPSILAFSGPGAYDDYFVPACPPAQFCACGNLRDKMEALLFSRSSLSRREQNDLFWAALAPGFTLSQGFESVTGGSWEHFTLSYEHPEDGRKQFCSGVNSFTFSPQSGEDAVHRAEYTSGCHFWTSPPACDDGFDSAGTSSCGWFGWSSKRRCVVRSSIAEATGFPTVHQAADMRPHWSASSTIACTKKCGGGIEVRGCHTGSGQFAGEYCERLDASCNTQACRMTTTGWSWWPSCPSGYSHASTDWSWGRRRYTCREES